MTISTSPDSNPGGGFPAAAGERAQLALRMLSVVAAGLGAGAVLQAPRGLRALGMAAEGRSEWGLRMFGIRELVLALGLARAAHADDRRQAALMADLVSAAQVGDMLLALGLALRSELTGRALAAVWLGALPTLVLTEAIRRSVQGPAQDRS